MGAVYQECCRKPYVCEECDERFCRYMVLRDHQRYHATVKLFRVAREVDNAGHNAKQCYGGMGYEEMYIKEQRVEKPHSCICFCKYCIESVATFFGHSDSLEFHGEAQTGEGYGEYDNSFSHSASLNSHQVGTLSFCEECGKTIDPGVSLKSHMLMHELERLYSCNGERQSLDQNPTMELENHNMERCYTYDGGQLSSYELAPAPAERLHHIDVGGDTYNFLPSLGSSLKSAVEGLYRCEGDDTSFNQCNSVKPPLETAETEHFYIHDDGKTSDQIDTIKCHSASPTLEKVSTPDDHLFNQSASLKSAWVTPEVEELYTCDEISKSSEQLDSSVASTTETFYECDEDGKSSNQCLSLPTATVETLNICNQMASSNYTLPTTVEYLNMFDEDVESLNQSGSLECPLSTPTVETFNVRDKDRESLDESSLTTRAEKLHVGVNSFDQGASLQCSLPIPTTTPGAKSFIHPLESPTLKKIYDEHDESNQDISSKSPSLSHTVEELNVCEEDIESFSQRPFVKCPFQAPTVKKFFIIDDSEESSEKTIYFQHSTTPTAEKLNTLPGRADKSFDRKNASSLTRTVEKLHVYDNGKVVIDQTAFLNYVCTECGKSFRRKSHLTRHMTKKSRPCNSFDLKSQLTTHKCDICGEIFMLKGSVTRHMKIHTEKRSFKCNVCNKTFRQGGDLNRHHMTHTGVKPHACDVCGKSFVQKAQLKSHSWIHTDERPHKCLLCDRSFGRRAHLRDHMRCHTGQKPYKCDVCHVSLTRSSSLTVHMKIHSKEKSYKCEKCDKRFIRRTNMKSHMKRHVKYPHRCGECGRYFVKECDMLAHEKTHSSKKVKRKLVKECDMLAHEKTHSLKKVKRKLVKECDILAHEKTHSPKKVKRKIVKECDMLAHEKTHSPKKVKRKLVKECDMLAHEKTHSPKKVKRKSQRGRTGVRNVKPSHKEAT